MDGWATNPKDGNTKVAPPAVPAKHSCASHRSVELVFLSQFNLVAIDASQSRGGPNLVYRRALACHWREENGFFPKGDVGKETGLLRCYISALKTWIITVRLSRRWRKFVRALESAVGSSPLKLASPRLVCFIHLAQDPPPKAVVVFTLDDARNRADVGRPWAMRKSQCSCYRPFPACPLSSE